jgi:Na+(H+)/acetate symporter ActP
MKIHNLKKRSGLTYRYRVMAFATMAFFLITNAHGPLLAQTIDWNQANNAGAASTGFWQGVSTVYSIIYGVFWVIAAITFGMGWIKFKNGNTAAAVLCAGGGAGLGLTPFLIQWFRALGNGGQLM